MLRKEKELFGVFLKKKWVFFFFEGFWFKMKEVFFFFFKPQNTNPFYQSNNIKTTQKRNCLFNILKKKKISPPPWKPAIEVKNNHKFNEKKEGPFLVRKKVGKPKNLFTYDLKITKKIMERKDTLLFPTSKEFYFLNNLKCPQKISNPYFKKKRSKNFFWIPKKKAKIPFWKTPQNKCLLNKLNL